MRCAPFLLSPFFVLTLLTACHHDDPNRPPHEGDRQSGPGGGFGANAPGIPGDAGTDADADGGLACTDLSNTGSSVDENAVTGDFTALGGTILDGTYNVVEARRYLGPSGQGGPTSTSYKGTIRITNGTTYESVLTAQTGSTPAVEARSQGTLTPNGLAALMLALTCPGTSQEQLTYTAANTSLTLSNTVTKVTFTLTKQP